MSNVSVIGLGYVGFPLAILSSLKGHNTKGIDKNRLIIDKIINGEYPYVPDNFIKTNYKKGLFKVSTELSTSDIYLICVPTPVKQKTLPDLLYVINAAKEISKVIENDQLVIIESTIYPGVCEEVVLPILNKSGKIFHLSHCPERVNPGDEKWNVSNIPRVAGSLSKIGLELTLQFYRSILDAKITGLSQIKAAEATKIMENTFRDINIAFVNEMAQSFYKLGIDIKEVIDGASTKPFGFLPHFPGAGVGGHCIAVDPYYMIEKGKEVGFHHDFLTLARKINSRMPEYTVHLLEDGLNHLGLSVKNTHIGVLGVSYKANVGDDRESPTYEVLELLLEKGAKVEAYDPYFEKYSKHKSTESFVKDKTAIILMTNHSFFINNVDWIAGIRLIVDGRNSLDSINASRKGAVYVGIGRPFVFPQ